MIKKDKLCKNKGVVVSDAIIAILILLLFSGIVISLITNINLESKRIKINSQELDYLTEVFEYAEACSYDDVTESNLIQYVNNKNLDIISAGTDLNSLTTPYRIVINVEKYNETANNTNKLDLLKIVTAEITYTLGEKDYTMEASKIKKRTVEDMRSLLNN